MSIQEISPLALGAMYGLLIVPLGVMLWSQAPLMRDMLVAVCRMTVQLLFVGFYLEVVFELNNPWINLLWIAVMIGVADLSITHSAGLRIRMFWGPLFLALLAGTLVPLLFFLGAVLNRSDIVDAQYVIPIAGMILGNCLRGNVVSLRKFYFAIRDSEKVFRQALADGAELWEALRPYIRAACEEALSPTVATIATIGLVTLPGMMTGVILGGVAPMTAIKYQLAIMIAILCGTALTVALALRLSQRISFDPFGNLRGEVFR